MVIVQHTATPIPYILVVIDSRLTRKSGLRHLQNSTRSVPRVMDRWSSNIFRPCWMSFEHLSDFGVRFGRRFLEQISKGRWRSTTELVDDHAPCSILSLLHVWHRMLTCRGQEDTISTFLLFQPVSSLDFLLLDHDLQYFYLSSYGQLMISQSLAGGNRSPEATNTAVINNFRSRSVGLCSFSEDHTLCLQGPDIYLLAWWWVFFTKLWNVCMCIYIYIHI